MSGVLETDLMFIASASNEVYLPDPLEVLSKALTSVLLRVREISSLKVFYFTVFPFSKNIESFTITRSLHLMLIEHLMKTTQK